MSNLSYTREELEDAVSASLSFRQIREKLGRGSRRALRRWCQEWGVSTAHFLSSRRPYTKEMLAPLVEKAKSYVGVRRALGLRPHGGAQSHLRKRISEFGLDTSHFTSRAWSRGKSFPNRRKTPEEIFVVRPDNSRRAHGDFLKRALLEVGVEHACAVCGLGPKWQGKPLVLIVDHIDGNSRDGRRHNLRFLCSNCDSQMPTYKNRKRKPIG